jgi:hypothetical protein
MARGRFNSKESGLVVVGSRLTITAACFSPVKSLGSRRSQRYRNIADVSTSVLNFKPLQPRQQSRSHGLWRSQPRVGVAASIRIPCFWSSSISQGGKRSLRGSVGSGIRASRAFNRH